MCLIVYAPKDRSQIPAAHLENAHWRNDDAWGIMYAQNGKLTLLRDVTDHANFRKHWLEAPNNTPIVAHFRYGTSGAMTADMAHPFPVLCDDEGNITKQGVDYYLKPMNCPMHILIYKERGRSYRDLPMRMAEFGCCHRNEAHGALHGIMRVRQFTQDDAHIFVREDQLVEEVRNFCELLDSVYADLGFTDYAVKLALRPEKRFGSDEMWDQAEAELREAVMSSHLSDAIKEKFEELPGEGAFYAPKLEFHLTDAIGRTWQVGTIQSDRVLPERLDASYVAEDGQRHRPIMLHRAILGTFERFIGILIEHHAGRFPTWLAPVQAVVATIVSDADDYAVQVAAELRKAGIRVETDLRNEKINYKVREHSLAKVPNLLVVGKREADEGTVALRRLGSQGQEMLTLGATIEMLRFEGTAPDLKR